MGQPDIRATVVDTVASVLAIDPDAVDGSLVGLPTFDSFRMIEIVERLEKRLAVEVDAEDLTPNNLNHVDRLCGLFGRQELGAAHTTTVRP